jgi:DNA-binding MarR family transcriptional regulator
MPPNQTDAHKAPDSAAGPLHPDDATSELVLISLRRIIRSIDLHSRSLVKRVGLTGPQLVILQQVKRSGEGPVGAIAKATSLSQATATGIIERLERRGLLSRRRSSSDRRRVLVSITAAGLKLLETAPPMLQDSFIEEFNHLQDWEQSMILSALQRLVAMMDASKIDAAPVLTTGPIEAAPETIPVVTAAPNAPATTPPSASYHHEEQSNG